MTKTVFQKTVLMFFLLMAMMAHGATEGEMPVKDPRLARCPDSPNCVSSLGDSENHAIAPYRYEKTLAEAKAVLKQVVGELSRTELVQEEEVYLHYEVRSFLFRFVDDVEFLFDDDTKTIHFRSASRVGYSDLGVNRKRMEEVRSLLEGRI
jgi:uncharacterized protein (DUF1499 family)